MQDQAQNLNTLSHTCGVIKPINMLPADPRGEALRLNESTSTYDHSILPARPKGWWRRNVCTVCRRRADHGPRLGGNDRYNHVEGSRRDRSRPSWRGCLQTALQVYSIELA